MARELPIIILKEQYKNLKGSRTKNKTPELTTEQKKNIATKNWPVGPRHQHVPSNTVTPLTAQRCAISGHTDLVQQVS